jgi:DNA polymerase III alpha subunit
MYLNVHSQYSLRYGTMSIATIVAEAASRGITQMALTDINNCTGMLEFMRECDKLGIKPIAGMEIRKNNRLLYICLAKNREGVREINEFVSQHNLSQTEKPDECPAFKHAFCIYPFSYKKHLKENEFIGIRYDELHFLYRQDISAFKEKLVALQPVFVRDKIEFRLHQYLRSIDTNSLLSTLNQSESCSVKDMFLDPGELEAKFAKYSFVIDQTGGLMAQCVMDYPRGQIKLNRKTFTGNANDDQELLKKLAFSGVISRYGKGNKAAVKKVKEELAVIF